MSKVIKAKNKLKDLIYIQENKPCSKQTVQGIFRSLLKPVLESPEEKGFVAFRLNSVEKFNGLLKRLEYTSVDIFDFSKNSKNLTSDAWENTEFLYVLTPRYGSVFIWDYDVEEMENLAGYYILHNSINLRDSFDVIKEYSISNISEYSEQFKPDRRDNILLNKSIRGIVDLLNETTQEKIISDMEKNSLVKDEDWTKRLEFVNSKSRYVIHEIRNQLSICELYSNIIQKSTNDKKCENAVNCIKTAIKIADSALMDLKTLDNKNLQVHDLKELLETAVSLAKAYQQDTSVEFKLKIDETKEVLSDETKFLAAMVNIMKNAIESGCNYIKIDVEYKNNAALIVISNNGEEISEEKCKKIFDEGFTTKTNGSGLGLYICKKTLEEQFASLKLLKSDKKSTEFEVTVSTV